RGVDRSGVAQIGRVRATLARDELCRAAETVAQLLGFRNRDRGVSGAVQDQRGAADLAEPAGDVVAVHQAAERMGESLPVELRPLGVPRLRVDAAQDDRGDDLLHRLWALRQPDLLHLLVARRDRRVLLARLGVDERERAYPPGFQQRRPHAEEATL